MTVNLRDGSSVIGQGAGYGIHFNNCLGNVNVNVSGGSYIQSTNSTAIYFQKGSFKSCQTVSVTTTGNNGVDPVQGNKDLAFSLNGVSYSVNGTSGTSSSSRAVPIN